MRTLCTFFISAALAGAVSDVGTAQTGSARASFHFTGMTLRQALDSLMKMYPVSIVYRDSDVEEVSVTAACPECSLEQALNTVLERTPLNWIMNGSQVILKRRPAAPDRAASAVSGFVTDSLTGVGIAGAIVRLEKREGQVSSGVAGWCPVNDMGFFSLTPLSPGAYLLVARAVGYRTAEIPLTLGADESVRHDITLQEQEIRLQEVTVEGQRPEFSASGGITRGVFIRSFPTDQNQYLLDGSPIYNPSHFGGVLSSFNTEVLNDVQILAGGPPPYYGGRIGGILDLSVRDGTREKLSGSAGTGSLGSHLTMEGPISNASSFLVSGRRGYPDAAVPFLEHYGKPGRQGTSELIAKLTHSLSGSSRVFLDGYLGNDSYANGVGKDTLYLSNRFSWGNSAVNLRWIGIASPSYFFQASAGFTRYDVKLEQGLAGPGRSLSFLSDYAIEDFSVRAHAEQYYDIEHTFRAGVELTHHSLRGSVSDFATQIAPIAFDGSPSWELSVYLEDQWRFLPGVMAELGARATSFTGAQGTLSAVDPRFSLLVSPGSVTRLYASFSTVNQFMHPYRNSGVFLLYPAVFWYPSGETVKPSTALQFTVGAQGDLGDNRWEASAEGFYRVVEHLHEFVLNTSVPRGTDLDSAILFGTGRSYGFEVSLRKRTGDLTGSISYTLSWSSNEFRAINHGDPFAPRFDRRHEIQVSGSYSPVQEWECGAVAVLALESESTLSSPPALFVGADPRNRTNPSMVPGWLIDVNGGRFPGFQRLELLVQHRLALGSVSCTLSLRLVNAYGLIDPFDWQLVNSPDARLQWTASVRDLRLFPLFPTAGITVRF